MNRFITRLFVVLSIVLVVGSVFYFSFRDRLLNKIVTEKVQHFNRNHEASIQFDKIHFKGLATVCFDSLLVKTEPYDSLVFIGSLAVNLKISQLLAGRIGFRKIELEHADIHFGLDKLKHYYRAFTHTPDTASRSDLLELNISKKFEGLLKRIFVTIPTTFVAKDVTFTFSFDSLGVTAYTGNLSLKNGKLASLVRFTDHKQIQTALIEGKINSGHRSVELIVKPQEVNTMLSSPLAGLFGAEFRYQSLMVGFSEKKKKGDVLKLEANCVLDQFEIYQKTLSSKKITFPGCSMKFDLSIGANFVQLDSISEITVGKLTLHPYLRYGISPVDTFFFACSVPGFTVSDFYYSLPVELFPNLKDIEADGIFSYHAKMSIDLKQPDSLRLESHLQATNFVLKQINPELLKMKGSFAYTAYEKGYPIRTFAVGPESAGFLFLNQIPVLLQQAVLTAEDGSFYGHQGFLIDGIQRALVQNIKEKKIFRGGSTISQQLIKNVYLSREKTLSRKLEEFMLVWLIESNRLVSKSRMLEVYLNIIEWGPNVFGAKEAARFYFNKNPNQLNAAECIFMASVLPSPKKFYYRFDKAGKPAPFMLNYYTDMAGKLYGKGLIPSANGDSIASMLRITGPAKLFLRTDTFRVDSVLLDDIGNY